MFVSELCESVEEKIISLGGKPAFPCNVSQNDEAAHYSSGIRDNKKIEYSSVVKVDVGVHVEGYIADAALTVTFSNEYLKMVQMNRQLLEQALKTIKAGGPITSVAEVVEQGAHRAGFRPIANLAGHQLDCYVIHAGISVPNVREPTDIKFKAEAAYAIEPFLVPFNARGWVSNGNGGNIYRLASRKRTKDESLDQLLNYIWDLYKSLPFSPRWLAKEFGEEQIIKLLSELDRRRLVMQYPMLVEVSGAKVSQFEHTVFVKTDGVIVTTTA